MRVIFPQRDRLYVSVTNPSTADAIARLGLDVNRHAIQLATPIRELGIV